MLDKKKMERINELARKAKTCELSAAEKTEQHALRQEYLTRFREMFRSHLDNIEIVDEAAPAGGGRKN
ncbi:MAG: DUF896 domain-containing protein [Clostridiales Family XIII bacterium]|jgi:uncharacterized protein YnzC (UPF0291/DUF896 family)|nr:DUF896 domain-containing protein [Clostridiales Family XIII bacterium]